MQYGRESSEKADALAKLQAETARKAEENRAHEIELANMRLQLEMRQMEQQRRMILRNES